MVYHSHYSFSELWTMPVRMRLYMFTLLKDQKDKEQEAHTKQKNTIMPKIKKK